MSDSISRRSLGATAKFRDDVQGLRGIAVLLVVLYHAHVPLLGGGFVGVDVFFVISGFVISALLLRELDQTGSIKLARFFARRARRLLPASLAVVACVISALPWLLSPVEARDIVSAGRAMSVYLANIWFAGRAVDYLGGTNGNPFLHAWSLAIEEQFYLFWPLILLGLNYFKPAGGKRLTAFAVSVVSIASFAGCLWMTARDQPWAFFGMPFRAWEFGAGALAYLAISERRDANKHPWLGWVGAAMVASSAIWITESLMFPGAWALFPVAGTALLLWSTHSGHVRLSKALSYWPLARLGDVSYSWYLWHWPALVFAAHVWPGGGAAARALAVIASLLVAFVSLRFLENPIRFGGFLARKDWVVVGLAVLTTATVGLLLSWNLLLLDRKLESEPYARWVAAAKDRAGPTDLKCQADFDAVTVGTCTFGSIDSPLIVVLVGDSHASHWFPAMERLAQQHQWKLVSLSKAACPMLDADVPLANRLRAYHECSIWRDNTIARIKSIRPSLVVVANFGAGYKLNPDVWEVGVSGVLSRLSDTGAAVAVIHDTPSPDRNAPQCLARAYWEGRDPSRSCIFMESDALRRSHSSRTAEVRAIGTVPSAFAIDLAAAFCENDICPTESNGLVRFTDSHHLTSKFSAQLAPFIEASLRAHERSFPQVARLFTRHPAAEGVSQPPMR